jgi:ribosome-associated protein
MTKNPNPPKGIELVHFAAARLFEKKAEQVQTMDLQGLSDVADWFLVGTCSSEAQMQAILKTLDRDLKSVGVRPLGTEYRAGVRWAVLDVGEIMVHLFEPTARLEYSLDRLWADAPMTDLDAKDFIIHRKEDQVDNDLI